MAMAAGWAHLIPGVLVAREKDGMRRFKIKKIRAFDRKGKSIAGTIELVHSDYWLDMNEGPGKLYLFALTRRGRLLERADSLQLEVVSASNDRTPRNMQVKVLYADIFDLDNVNSGDYWDDVPESLRFDIQDKLADELMSRAQPEIRTSLFQTRHERYPFEGVTFAVSGLEELEVLFAPE